MLTFQFSGADGEMLICETLTTGAIGQKVHFHFSPEWENLRKTAVFSVGEVCRVVDGIEDETEIPAEMLQEPMQKLYVGVYGMNEEGTVAIPTIMVMGPEIRAGADPENDPALDPEHPVWKQVQGDIIACSERIDTLQEEVTSLWGEGDWNLLKNRPFGSVPYESFGSFPTAPEVSLNLIPHTYYKISDLTPSVEELLTAKFSITCNGEYSERIPLASEVIATNERATLFQFGTEPSCRFLVVREAGEFSVEYSHVVYSSTAPEAGIYCGVELGSGWVSLDVGVSYIRITKIDPIYIPSAEAEENIPILPSVTEEDNSKILQVVDGVWAAVAVADSAVKTYVDDYINSALEGDY